MRVSKSELEEISTSGAVFDVIEFGAASALRYRLEAGSFDEIAVEYSGSEIRVRVPQARAQRWASTEEVSITGEQQLDSGRVLQILIEKDFECLEPRPGEDSEDLFVNPAKTGI